MKARDLAERLGCRLDGDGEVDVSRIASVERAGPGDLTFLANPRYASAVGATRASAIILAEDAPAAPCTMLRTPQPYLMFGRALALLHPPPAFPAGVHPASVVEEGAEVAADACVGAFSHVCAGAVIGPRTVLHSFVFVGPGARLGADCVAHAHVSIRERVRIGDRVVLQNGAVVGSDGFGFATRADGTHEKIPQVGDVIVGDDVEIGANATIDRPPIGATRIGRGTKIDNLVQVAHGVDIGEDVFLAAQVGIAGSTTVGDRVVLAGQVGVAGHLTIGRGVRATAQTGIPNSVEPGALISGYPAIDNREWLKASAVFRRLPEMRKALNDLQKRLQQLEDAAAHAQPASER